jgi:hypothetical protein
LLATGVYKIEFNIYDTADPVDGQVPIWGPLLFDDGSGDGHRPRVNVIDGRFNVVLGPVDTDGDSILDAFSGGGDRFLEIRVDDGNPILPRQQFLTVPYAQQASQAEELTGTVDGSQVTGTISGLTSLSSTNITGTSRIKTPFLSSTVSFNGRATSNTNDFTIPAPGGSNADRHIYLLYGRFWNNHVLNSSYVWMVHVFGASGIEVTRLSSQSEGQAPAVGITRPNSTTIRIGSNNNGTLREVHLLRLL